MTRKEIAIATTDELEDGEMRQVSAGGNDILLARVGGAVEAVVLDSGERVEADLVGVGVGVRPATDVLEGVALHEDGGVFVDRHLCAADGVYAAGDIAYFPSPHTGERQRIEHWRTAEQQGRTAARNMAGKNVEFCGVPFFWTRRFGAGLLYVGHAAGWDEIIFEGDVPSHEFLAFYIKDHRVLAVAGMPRPRDGGARRTDASRSDGGARPAPRRPRGFS